MMDTDTTLQKGKNIFNLGIDKKKIMVSDMGDYNFGQHISTEN